MRTTWRWAIFGGAVALHLVGPGLLSGVVTERSRFDRQRAAVLTRYDEVVRRWQAQLLMIEREVAPRGNTLVSPRRRRRSVHESRASRPAGHPGGLAAGIVTAFFGVGGGLVIVPVLIVALDFSVKRAVGSSLATIVTQVGGRR